MIIDDLKPLEELTKSKVVEVEPGIFELNWGDGDLFRFSKDGHLPRCIVHIIVSQADKGRGQLVHQVLPDFFRSIGIDGLITGDPVDEGLRSRLLNTGFDRVAGGSFYMSFKQPCKVDEYAAWKRGEIDEPSWRVHESKEQ